MPSGASWDEPVRPHAEGGGEHGQLGGFEQTIATPASAIIPA
jgi:hypothetical protein